MSTRVREVLAGAEQMLRAGEVSLVGAIKQALWYTPTTTMIHLKYRERRLLMMAVDLVDSFLVIREPGSPYVSVWAQTRPSVQVADLVEYVLAQVSATNLTIRQG